MTTTRTATGVALHSSSLIPSGGNGFDMLAPCLSLNRRCYNLTLPICAVTAQHLCGMIDVAQPILSTPQEVSESGANHRRQDTPIVNLSRQGFPPVFGAK